MLARRRSPSVWVRARKEDWWKSIVPNFDSDQWISHFRMSKDTFYYLCGRLESVLGRKDTNFRRSVPLEKRVAISLFKLATNAEYRSVAHLFGVGISTACDCLKDFCSAIEEILLPEVIQFPGTEKLKVVSIDFEQRWGLPQCVGAVDGTHIPILAPQEYHAEYCNNQGWYSIILQAVVDSRGLFWHVFAGQPGSLCETSVLCLSSLWDIAEGRKQLSQLHRPISGQDFGLYIIGDGAYPLTSWLMKPYPEDGHLTPHQEMYNCRISEARSVVEMAFNRLKGRWKCLQKRNDCSLERVKSMVHTCCVLHNLCEIRGEDYREEWALTISFPQPYMPSGPEVVHTDGVEMRAALEQHLSECLYNI